MSKKVKAFYFANKDRKLRYNDNRCIRIGRTHKVSGEIELCKNGLHASARLIDALSHAPDSVLYLVEMGGDIIHSGDKLVASERTYLSSFNADKILREFARKQALINISKIEEYCTPKSYKLFLEWLRTGDATLQSAARSAARSAASLAARSSTWSEERIEARAAARAAEWSASESAVKASARSAEWSASGCAAARSAADKMLTRMIKGATGWDI